jgi:DNA polymerase-1
MILALDTENTTWNKGSPFDTRNANVCISYAYRQPDGVLVAGALKTEEARPHIERLLGEATCIVGFNLKYDLHWLRRLGYEIPATTIYCCQVAEFLLDRQQNPYPSLNGCADKYLRESKHDAIAEYWKRGVNTDAIPWDELSAYAAHDASLTLRVYEAQQANMPENLRKILKIRMVDMQGLMEMESNGLYIDRPLIEKKAKEAEDEIQKIRTSLNKYHNVPDFNWTSPAQLSALLYGGEITQEVRVPSGVVYKTGARKGEPKFAKEERVYVLPRMYKPINGSESAKEGQWSVSEEFLVQLKGGNKELINGILRIKELEKMNGTYLRGMLEFAEEMHFPNPEIVHGQFNQCVTKTGRLSSSKPNMQNIAGSIKSIFRSRYVHQPQLGT